jgi:hypothetical protein
MTHPANKAGFLQMLKDRIYKDFKLKRITLDERQALLEGTNDLQKKLERVYSGKEAN